MRTVLNFFSMLALGLMIAAVVLVAPSGNGAGSAVLEGFDIAAPALDYRSVIAGLGIGLCIALFARISWVEAARKAGTWTVSQAKRLWLISWAGVFLAILFYF